MSVAVVGKAAHKLAREQGFRTQFYLQPVWRNNHSTELFQYGAPNECYRVHPDDQAAFIARNTPAPVAKPKVKSVTVWQGMRLNLESGGYNSQAFNGDRDSPLIGSKTLVASTLSILAKKHPESIYQMQKLRITAEGTKVVERVNIN